MNLVALVNSFNRRALLQEALASLRAALVDWPGNAAIVVLDAGSTDGSREWLAAEAARTPAVPVLVLTPDPRAETSFSAGLNAAAAAALQHHPQLEWLLCFETDNWIAGPEPLRAAAAVLAEQPAAGAVGFTVRKHDGSPAGYGCRFPTIPQFIAGPHVIGRLHLDRPNGATQRTATGVVWAWCDVVYTSPLLVRRTAWERSGGLDAARFPFSESDLDWAWRLRALGWRQAVVETAGVVHDNRAQLSAWSERRALDFHRARLELLRRHRGPRAELAKPLLWLRHLVEWAALAALATAGRKPAAAAAVRRTLARTVFSNYIPDTPEPARRTDP